MRDCQVHRATSAASKDSRQLQIFWFFKAKSDLGFPSGTTSFAHHPTSILNLSLIAGFPDFSTAFWIEYWREVQRRLRHLDSFGHTCACEGKRDRIGQSQSDVPIGTSTGEASYWTVRPWDMKRVSHHQLTTPSLELNRHSHVPFPAPSSTILTTWTSASTIPYSFQREANYHDLFQTRIQLSRLFPTQIQLSRPFPARGQLPRPFPNTNPAITTFFQHGIPYFLLFSNTDSAIPYLFQHGPSYIQIPLKTITRIAYDLVAEFEV